MKLTRRSFATLLSLLPFVGVKAAKAKTVQNNPENLPVVVFENGWVRGIDGIDLDNLFKPKGFNWGYTTLRVWVNEKDRFFNEAASLMWGEVIAEISQTGQQMIVCTVGEHRSETPCFSKYSIRLRSLVNTINEPCNRYFGLIY